MFLISQPKGRTIKSSEATVPQLGARGEKVRNRRCTVCGMRADDIRTCPMVPYNQEHLEKMASGKKRGRPPGSGNKNSPAKRLQQLTETARQWLGLEMGQSTAKMQHHLHGGQADPKGRRTRFLRPSCAHSLNQYLRTTCSVYRSA